MAHNNIEAEGNFLSRHVLVVLGIFLFALVLVSSQVLLVRASNETVNIQTANSSINRAYTNVLAAEAAGGDITDLLARLNTAGELLAEAENAYHSGNLANVSFKASSATLIAGQVNNDATALLLSSRNNSQNRLLLTVSFSAITIAVFLVVLVLVWGQIKRGYHKKLLASKPEVVDDRS